MDIKTVILLAILICGKNLLGQTYQPILGSSNEWYYFSRTTEQDFTDLWETTGDTIIGSYEYKKVERTATHGTPYYFNEGFIREDTVLKKVYYINCPYACDTPEILLYDFSKLPGDTVIVTQPTGTQPLKSLILDSITTDLSFAQNPIYLLYAVDDVNKFYPIKWVEGIGSLAGLENNIWAPAPDGGTILLCANRNNIPIFHLPSSYPYYLPDSNTCVINYLGIDEFSSNSLTVFPNPASEVINISIGVLSFRINVIYLTDMHGRQILKTKEQTFPISKSIERGMYFIHVEFDNGEHVVRKVLIE